MCFLIADVPNCVTPTQTIPANIGSIVTMICEVDANPTNVTFLWRTKHQEILFPSSSTGSSSSSTYQYNNNHHMEQQKYSTETSMLILGSSSNSFSSSSSEQQQQQQNNYRKIIRNRLELRIESDDDYGQYQCWARNLAGDQTEPCLYNIYGK